MHGKLRDEFLDREEFEGRVQARAMGLLWKREYAAEGPRGLLGCKTPAEFAATRGMHAHRRNSERAIR